MSNLVRKLSWRRVTPTVCRCFLDGFRAGLAAARKSADVGSQYSGEAEEPEDPCAEGNGAGASGCHGRVVMFDSAEEFEAFMHINRQVLVNSCPRCRADKAGLGDADDERT